MSIVPRRCPLPLPSDSEPGRVTLPAAAHKKMWMISVHFDVPLKEAMEVAMEVANGGPAKNKSASMNLQMLRRLSSLASLQTEYWQIDDERSSNTVRRVDFVAGK